MFKTISDFPKYTHAELFRLNPINHFLIKKYPREDDKGFLARHWEAYILALHLVKDVIKDETYMDKITPIVVTPEEFYKIPNPSTSSCFNEWLEMYKKDKVSDVEPVILDSIPGTSEPLSIEVEGIPEDTRAEFTKIFEQLNKDGFVDPKDIE